MMLEGHITSIDVVGNPPTPSLHAGGAFLPLLHGTVKQARVTGRVHDCGWTPCRWFVWAGVLWAVEAWTLRNLKSLSKRPKSLPVYEMVLDKMFWGFRPWHHPKSTISCSEWTTDNPLRPIEYPAQTQTILSDPSTIKKTAKLRSCTTQCTPNTTIDTVSHYWQNN